SRHVRMDGTHTGKLSVESVRAALRRVRGSTLNFVPRGIPGGRNFCPAQQAEMGSPWSVALLRHAEPLPCRQGLFTFGQAAEIWRKKSGENYCIHRADLLQ